MPVILGLTFLYKVKNMYRKLIVLVALLVVTAFGQPKAWSINPVAGTALVPAQDNVVSNLISENEKLIPGRRQYIGVHLTMAPGWHIYYRDPGDIGVATRVQLTLPPGYSAAEAVWLKPTTFRDEEGGFVTHGYEGETVIAIPISVPVSAVPGSQITVEADVSWLACSTSCEPGQAKLSLTLMVAHSQAPPIPSASARHFANFPALKQGQESSGNGSIFDKDFKLAPGQSDANVWLVYLQFLGLAFVGGLILNFMPCVLPVVSLKILSFVKEAGESRSRVLKLGLAYAAGTISTCLALALAVIALQVAGISVGWGFQFQHPLFLLAMATLLSVMSLGLFGVFMVNVQAGEKLSSLSTRRGYTGSFFTGVIATILSTPCTAPFLGAAIGFAFAQPWWGILAVFAAIGAGLSSPYLLLSFNPRWQKLIPKPGAWMEYFKQAMGFVLLLSAVWLLSVLGSMVGSDGLVGGLVFIVATSFGAWLIGNFANFLAGTKQKVCIWTLAAAISLVTFYCFARPIIFETKMPNAEAGQQANANGIEWQPFSEALVNQSLADGKVVFLDFTAQWCQTCQLNEHTTLSSQAVVEAFKSEQVVALRGDWTRSNPQITKILQKFGRSGVPLYVVLSPKRPEQPLVLPEILTQSILLDAIAQAGI